ncbi:hypothetical protein [Formosa algae]|uniref:Membrane protein n=1 Tax=Formosa algae TaxID=225843 RepID=A0A9X0YM19_9FLAO|nr:hypothetical protein [Formosa algae]MBP1841119.1 putative membrane protein [Formosa algae]MDQ0336461.1 putative membrane protein [Formosa algae]OEI81422.1 hypothetical protein AST99_04080 [Formosa algae]PNW27955.1 hypothetical protein BKP44_11105 [Formosa algae]
MKQTINEGKNLAVISYLTFVGLIIAIIMNLEKRNPFTSFHIRQMLGLVIMLSVSQLIEKYLNSWLGTLCWFITFACWLYAFYHVIIGQKKVIPYIGEYFQEWFRNVR